MRKLFPLLAGFLMVVGIPPASIAQQSEGPLGYIVDVTPLDDRYETPDDGAVDSDYVDTNEFVTMATTPLTAIPFPPSGGGWENLRSGDWDGPTGAASASGEYYCNTGAPKNDVVSESIEFTQGTFSWSHQISGTLPSDTGNRSGPIGNYEIDGFLTFAAADTGVGTTGGSPAPLIPGVVGGASIYIAPEDPRSIV
ncbi:MAG: hypothetical protein ACT4PT_04865, partial [Methanobacteriota archaeon]